MPDFKRIGLRVIVGKSNSVFEQDKETEKNCNIKKTAIFRFNRLSLKKNSFPQKIDGS